MKELVEFIVKSLVDNPEDVSIKEMEGDKTFVLELKVGASDVGRVIGKQGKVISALRVLANAAAIKKNKRATIEILG